MDRTEEIEKLKKEIFSLKVKMAMSKMSREELLLASKEAQVLERKKDALIMELESSNGQVGFAFTDLMDVEELEVRKESKLW